ncbi:MAG: O-antigen ligase family protein [Flavobacteriales bacterium]|jgi:O-antigen ligase|nr:O-antigen ligase family protein [Flavobacteriales bacterium]
MDHNAFAAALTFALAVFAGLTIHRYVERGISHAVIGYGTLTLSTLTTIIFTYSRGAWVGLVVASLFAGFVYRRTRIARIALFMALPVIGVMAVFIVQGGRHLVTASAHGADLVAVVRSIGNTKNDPSNVDRLARWREAARMCGQAPLTGVGPGNYQFALAERWEQRSLEHVPVIVAKERMTPAVELGEHLLIRNDALRSPSSTGTAHSEYLLAFSEMGMIGGLAFLSLALIPVYTAAKSKRNLRGPWLAIALFSVVAYLVHGVFNNFLDEARIAFPFWISLAALAERSDQSEE